MEIAYSTDIGQQRKNNQDYVGVFKNQSNIQFAIVADGMGGHLGGDVASEMAVSHIGFAFEQTKYQTIDELVKWLIYEVQQENQRILDKGREFADLNGMGTTLVAAILLDHQFIVANIGDSRAYLLRQKKFEQLTEDHSLVNELVKQGEITKEAAKKHPQKNVITRTLGVSDDVDADVTVYDLVPGDFVLLCSDGLTNMLEDDQIKKTIETTDSLKQKTDSLIKQANEAGGLDNITALIIFENQEVTTK